MFSTDTDTTSNHQKISEKNENNKKFVYNSKELLTLINDTDDDMEYMSPHKYYDKCDDANKK